MKTKTDAVTKPDSVQEGIWQDNQRWLKLMAEQAQAHRQTRDPRLYRSTAKNKLVSPIPPDQS